jgi:hypothetical protein
MQRTRRWGLEQLLSLVANYPRDQNNWCRTGPMRLCKSRCEPFSGSCSAHVDRANAGHDRAACVVEGLDFKAITLEVE